MRSRTSMAAEWGSARCASVKMRKPRLLFLSMLVSSGPSERQAEAGSTLESALVEHLGCYHVVDGERIFSMNMGIAVDDMVAAKVLYERALERGAGVRLPL